MEHFGLVLSGHHLLSALDHKTSITRSLYIEVPVPGQQNERSCIYVLWVFYLFLWFIDWTVELFC